MDGFNIKEFIIDNFTFINMEVCSSISYLKENLKSFIINNKQTDSLSENPSAIIFLVYSTMMLQVFHKCPFP